MLEPSVGSPATPRCPFPIIAERIARVAGDARYADASDAVPATPVPVAIAAPNRASESAVAFPDTPVGALVALSVPERHVAGRGRGRERPREAAHRERRGPAGCSRQKRPPRGERGQIGAQAMHPPYGERGRLASDEGAVTGATPSRPLRHATTAKRDVKSRFPGSTGRPSSVGELHQDIAAIDGLTDLDEDVLHEPIDGRGDGVLDLHGLEHEQDLVRLDDLAVAHAPTPDTTPGMGAVYGRGTLIDDGHCEVRPRWSAAAPAGPAGRGDPRR